MAKFQNNKDWWADFHGKLLFALVIRCQGESAESKDFVEGLLNEWTPLSALRFFGKDDPLAEALKFCITPNEAALENADPRVATPSPVIWILFSDRSCALITGRRHTLRKYDLAEHFKERKPWYVTEWVHEMMWGKTLRHLVKRGIELAREAKEKHGADARVNLHLSWFGNELVGRDCSKSKLAVRWSQRRLAGDHGRLPEASDLVCRQGQWICKQPVLRPRPGLRITESTPSSMSCTSSTSSSVCSSTR